MRIVLEAEAEAEAVALKGEAEAFAIEAKAKAEAEQMNKKAEAFKEYKEAAMIDMMLKVKFKSTSLPISNQAHQAATFQEQRSQTWTSIKVSYMALSTSVSDYDN